MNVTASQLRDQHAKVPTMSRLAVRAGAAPHPHVDSALLFAIASRESWMRNILGDRGHGRGMFQVDDRYWQKWLASVWGCRAGTSIPVWPPNRGGAAPVGRVPTVTRGAAKCAGMIEANIETVTAAGVREGDRTFVALCAYNAGPARAVDGWKVAGREGADRVTAGRDYASDVLDRARELRSIIHRGR